MSHGYFDELLQQAEAVDVAALSLALQGAPYRGIIGFIGARPDQLDDVMRLCRGANALHLDFLTDLDEALGESGRTPIELEQMPAEGVLLAAADVYNAAEAFKQAVLHGRDAIHGQKCPACGGVHE